MISRTLKALKGDTNRCKNRIWKFLDFHGIPTPFKNKEEARNEIFEYIEIYYNRKRRHKANGRLSPVEYENLTLVNSCMA